MRRLDIKINLDKQFKSAYPKQERSNGCFGDNWNLYKSNFLMLCESYEIPTMNLTRMFPMKLVGSTLTQLDIHVEIDYNNWERVDALFTTRFSSATKQEEVSDELAALKIDEFQKDMESEKGALTKLIYRAVVLTSLALP